MAKRSTMSAEERRDVVLRLLRKEEPASALARRYGISDSALYQWRDRFLEGGIQALKPGGGTNKAQDRRIKELEKAIAERDQVIGELTISNRILKKRSDALL